MLQGVLLLFSGKEEVSDGAGDGEGEGSDCLTKSGVLCTFCGVRLFPIKTA